MDGANGTRRTHPVHVVHRVGAGLLGLGLWVFAALGFANGLPYLSTSGEWVLGLSSNGLLSTISLVAGAVLIAAAMWKGPAASTATAAIRAAFVLSGLVHLAILNTPLNVLAFRMPNVLFSVIAGLLLLVLGSYGRFAGGLPPDSPYRSHRPPGEVPEPRSRSAPTSSSATRPPRRSPPTCRPCRSRGRWRRSPSRPTPPGRTSRRAPT